MVYLEFVFCVLVRGSPLAGGAVEGLADLSLFDAGFRIGLQLFGGYIPIFERILPRLQTFQNVQIISIQFLSHKFNQSNTFNK